MTDMRGGSGGRGGAWGAMVEEGGREGRKEQMREGVKKGGLER